MFFFHYQYEEHHKHMSGFFYWSLFYRNKKPDVYQLAALEKGQKIFSERSSGGIFEQASMLLPTTLVLLEFSPFLLPHCTRNVLLHPVFFIRMI